MYAPFVTTKFPVTVIVLPITAKVGSLGSLFPACVLLWARLFAQLLRTIKLLVIINEWLCYVVEALHLRISHAYFHLDFDFYLHYWII